MTAQGWSGAARWVGRGALVVLAGVFLWAGVTKVRAPEEMLAAIETYRLLPYTLAVVAALVVPWLEIVGSLALAWPRWRLAGLAVLGALLGVFLVAIGQAWARGLSIECGCFGGGGGGSTTPRDYAVLVIRDLALLAAVAAGWRWSGRARQ